MGLRLGKELAINMETQIVVAGYGITKNKLLLIKHKKLGLWLPVGGHIDKNEVPDDALVREFREEVGLEIRILNRNDLPAEGNVKRQLAEPFHVNVHNVGDHDHCCLFYLCEIINPDKIQINKDEVSGYRFIEYGLLSLYNDIPPDVRNTGKRAFDLYSQLDK